MIGATAHATGNANLSLPTIFYGIPILLGGLALKSSELPPALRVTPPNTMKQLREQAPKSSSSFWVTDALALWPEGPSGVILEALKLWDDDTPRSWRKSKNSISLGATACGCASPWGDPLQRWQESRIVSAASSPRACGLN